MADHYIIVLFDNKWTNSTPMNENMPIYNNVNRNHRETVPICYEYLWISGRDNKSIPGQNHCENGEIIRDRSGQTFDHYLTSEWDPL